MKVFRWLLTPVPMDFQEVMNDAVETPLDSYLPLPSESESIERDGGAYVANTGPAVASADILKGPMKCPRDRECPSHSHHAMHS
jgi:hypothetical protein